MSQLRLNVYMAGGTVLLFIAMLAANQALFAGFDYAPDIHWVYLPAGVRVLCTLLFGGAGAIGLLLASWLLCFFYFFPDDWLRALIGGAVSAAAPYLVYKIAQKRFGLHASLRNLTPRRLLIFAFACSLAGPLLLHIWFALRGEQGHLVRNFLAMSIGDLSGTAIVLYGAKALLARFAAVRTHRTR